MNLALSGAAVLAVLAAVAFFLLFRRLLSRGRDTLNDLEWSRDFSVARYRPMERLFLEDDYRFLAAQPGFHPGIRRKLQSERRRIFRRYLRCLSRDFDRLTVAAKLLVVHSHQDRPDLASILLKQRAVFTYAMAVVQCRLALQPLGIGTVDVRPLVNALEGMRDQLRQVSRHAQPSLA
jgi:hypothetical protein